ncbi:MAG: outer membrane beta-barrel protein [Desulfuromonadaceae bacterium]|nr:outer membrane beta-barrel protein [Desulfuromonadaceae bacterium]
MNRICRIIITLCLPLLLCSPAMAQHAGPYIGAFVGGNVLMDAKSSDSSGLFTFTFNPDMQGSAVLGWEFAPGNPVGTGRVELEYTRRSNPLDQVKFVEGSFKGDGDIKADSLMINFFGVYPDNTKWAPYFGVGIGAARIETSSLKVTGQPLASGSDTVLAYQLGAGVDYSLTKYLNLDLGYRFFNSIRPEFTEANGQKLKMDYVSHNLVFGLRVGF